jgi:hypothetical protein
MRLIAKHALAALAVVAVGILPAMAAQVPPTHVPGNPKCKALGFEKGFKLEAPQPGVHVETWNSCTITITVSSDRRLVDFATDGCVVQGVLVKGGPAANLYDYRPFGGAFVDSALVSPLNKGGQVPQISHVDFCDPGEEAVE